MFDSVFDSFANTVLANVFIEAVPEYLLTELALIVLYLSILYERLAGKSILEIPKETCYLIHRILSFGTKAKQTIVASPDIIISPLYPTVLNNRAPAWFEQNVPKLTSEHNNANTVAS